MTFRWLIPLCLPAIAPAVTPGVCNASALYLGETHVLLTVLSWGTGVGDDLQATVRSQCGSHTAEGNRIHRIFPDLSGKPVFGYDLVIAPDPARRAFHVTVAKPTGGLATFSKLPAPVTVGDGDRLDVPVLENPKTGAHILDSYAIATRGTGVTSLPKTTGFPAYASAGTLLHLEQPRLRSEVADLGDNPQFGITGPLVWIYSRWLGRVSFSATERAGFRRLGVAEGSAIRFSDGVEHYRLDLGANALAQPGAWWLWVKREPDFKPPPGPWTPEELHAGLLALGAGR